MRNYILSRPKGTFKEATLKGFVKRGYITEDDYNQLTVETVTPVATEKPATMPATESDQQESPSNKE